MQLTHLAYVILDLLFSSSGKRLNTCKRKCVSVPYLPTEASFFSISVSFSISQIGVLLLCRREFVRVE